MSDLISWMCDGGSGVRLSNIILINSSVISLFISASFSFVIISIMNASGDPRVEEPEPEPERRENASSCLI